MTDELEENLIALEKIYREILEELRKRKTIEKHTLELSSRQILEKEVREHKISTKETTAPFRDRSLSLLSLSF